MFRNDIVSRRIGRIGFGVMLIVGAFALIARSHLPWPNAAAPIMVGSWLLAFAVAGVLSRTPVRGDHGPDAFEKAALIVPSIGIVLMLPLLIHLPFALIIGGTRAFDAWVSLAIWISGPTTIVAAVLAAVRARALVVGDRPMGVWTIYAIGVGVSCLPFAVFVLPPAITAVTGLFVVGLLQYQAELLERERVQAGMPGLPRAIAVAA